MRRRGRKTARDALQMNCMFACGLIFMSISTLDFGERERDCTVRHCWCLSVLMTHRH